VSRLRLALLTAEHDLTGFDCGHELLTGWLMRHALAGQRADLARTYLALQDETVIGYVSLTTGSVHHEETPKRFTRGMPRHPIPTILIARLAVHQRHQGRQLGSRLLAEALRRAVVASDAAAARLVVVDAIDERAAAFYSNRGFVDLPENPLRLYRKVADIRRSLSLPEPLSSTAIRMR
jgi:GNAT superfamily N-acetyltransferase